MYVFVQQYIQVILVIAAAVCVPWMLLTIPVYYIVKNKRAEKVRPFLWRGVAILVGGGEGLAILIRDLPPSLQQGVGFGIYIYIKIGGGQE